MLGWFRGDLINGSTALKILVFEAPQFYQISCTNLYQSEISGKRSGSHLSQQLIESADARLSQCIKSLNKFKIYDSNLPSHLGALVSGKSYICNRR